MEAIIGLPNDMFHNTGIATYIWVLNKQKDQRRKGKVQLIDARNLFVKMRKSIGSKRNELSPENIQQIAKEYEAFEQSDLSKIFNNEDFFYRTITVDQPLQLNYAFTPDRIAAALNIAQVRRLPDEPKQKLEQLLTDEADRRSQADLAPSTNRKVFTAEVQGFLDAADVELTPAALRSFVTALGEQDSEGEVVMVRGKPQPSTDLRDTENVPWDEDVNEYFEREVLPFVPNAWLDESKTKEGAEIPFTRHFYEYTPPRPLEEIDRDLNEVLGRIQEHLETMR